MCLHKGLLVCLPGVCDHYLLTSSRRCGDGALPPSARGSAAQTRPAHVVPLTFAHARCSGARGSDARVPRGPVTPRNRLETLKPIHIALTQKKLQTGQIGGQTVIWTPSDTKILFSPRMSPSVLCRLFFLND